MCRKVNELEREIRRLQVNRAKYAAGQECCFCTILMHGKVIPTFVRVWEA